MNGNKWTTIWGHDVFSRNRFPYYFSAIFGKIPFQFLFFLFFYFWPIGFWRVNSTTLHPMLGGSPPPPLLSNITWVQSFPVDISRSLCRRLGRQRCAIRIAANGDAGRNKAESNRAATRTNERNRTEWLCRWWTGNVTRARKAHKILSDHRSSSRMIEL